MSRGWDGQETDRGTMTLNPGGGHSLSTCPRHHDIRHTSRKHTFRSHHSVSLLPSDNESKVGSRSEVNTLKRWTVVVRPCFQASGPAKRFWSVCKLRRHCNKTPMGRSCACAVISTQLCLYYLSGKLPLHSSASIGLSKIQMLWWLRGQGETDDTTVFLVVSGYNNSTVITSIHLLSNGCLMTWGWFAKPILHI